MSDTADWLRRFAQQLEDQHAPSNLSIGMREAADQMDQQRETTLQLLGQVGQLSDELERTKREAERAQDAYGVRFLNYLEETARLTDEIEKLRAALREAASDFQMSLQIDKQKDEKIDRLRAALRLIAEHPVEQSGQWEIGSKEMLKVARAALGGGEVMTDLVKMLRGMTQTETDAEFIARIERDSPGIEKGRYHQLARRGAAVQWRPISNAQRDSRERYIVAHASEHGRMVNSGCFMASWLPNREAWCGDDNGYWGGSYEPTHFIPLTALGEPPHE